MSRPLVVYCDSELPASADELLVHGLAGHELRRAAKPLRSNLRPSGDDPALREAEVAFGQPAPHVVLAAPMLRWVHLTSAGYTRYDDRAFREAAAAKGLVLSTSSSVYADPCAEHVLAMMLAAARRVPEWLADQASRRFASAERRRESVLLRGQKVLLLGFGAIGRRLSELLAPFEVELRALRRRARGNEPVTIIGLPELDAALGWADHVVDLLPENAETLGLLDAYRIALLRPSAVFYNVGRGSSLDHEALAEALSCRRLAAAFLDVTEPEPLPDDHPLWSSPHCHLSPHSAGGRNTEHLALVRHFLAELGRYAQGEAPRDRVI